jgi:hypothetical protein
MHSQKNGKAQFFGHHSARYGKFPKDSASEAFPDSLSVLKVHHSQLLYDTTPTATDGESPYYTTAVIAMPPTPSHKDNPKRRQFTQTLFPHHYIAKAVPVQVEDAKLDRKYFADFMEYEDNSSRGNADRSYYV